MELSKKIILSIILAWVSVSGANAFLLGDYVAPEDIATIEALIHNHQAIAKQEQTATGIYGLITFAQEGTTALAGKYNKARSVLNQKLASGVSWLRLGSEILETTLQVKTLGETYADFSKTAYQAALKNPLALIHWGSANKKCGAELYKLQCIIAFYLAEEFNLLKASDQEKFSMISKIQYQVTQMTSILRTAIFKIHSLMGTDIVMTSINHFLNSDVEHKIANQIIMQWESENKKQ